MLWGEDYSDGRHAPFYAWVRHWVVGLAKPYLGIAVWPAGVGRASRLGAPPPKLGLSAFLTGRTIRASCGKVEPAPALHECSLQAMANPRLFYDCTKSFTCMLP